MPTEYISLLDHDEPFVSKMRQKIKQDANTIILLDDDIEVGRSFECKQHSLGKFKEEVISLMHDDHVQVHKMEIARKRKIKAGKITSFKKEVISLMDDDDNIQVHNMDIARKLKIKAGKMWAYCDEHEIKCCGAHYRARVLKRALDSMQKFKTKIDADNIRSVRYIGSTFGDLVSFGDLNGFLRTQELFCLCRSLKFCCRTSKL
jgi:hypothetical protein